MKQVISQGCDTQNNVSADLQTSVSQCGEKVFVGYSVHRVMDVELVITPVWPLCQIRFRPQCSF